LNDRIEDNEEVYDYFNLPTADKDENQNNAQGYHILDEDDSTAKLRDEEDELEELTEEEQEERNMNMLGALREQSNMAQEILDRYSPAKR